MSPEEREALDAEFARGPEDPEVLERVGLRFFQAGEYARAHDALAAALARSPTYFRATHAGRAAEKLGRFDSAEQYYRRAAGFPMSGGQREELSRYQAELARARLIAEAREAIAREFVLSTLPADPATIAVLPWTFVGTDESLRPLGTGLAHLMVTDLAKISSIRLIERERVQVLLDEIALAQQGRVDSTTAARTGRLLRAGRVLAGVVRQTSRGIELEASIIRTSDAAVEASRSETGRVERLFAAQKIVVLDLVDQLGLAVTPAERRELSERPAQDLQAFLALSRGLEAERRGDFRPAALDRIAGGIGGDGSARAEALWSALFTIAPSTGGLIDQRTRLPVSTPRTPEALGQDNPSRIATIGDVIIIIPRP